MPQTKKDGMALIIGIGPKGKAGSPGAAQTPKDEDDNDIDGLLEQAAQLDKDQKLKFLSKLEEMCAPYMDEDNEDKPTATIKGQDDDEDSYDLGGLPE